MNDFLFDYLDEKVEEDEDKKDYVKIVYQTKPIGKEGIILYLTTFDTEAFEKDQGLKKIPQKEKTIELQINPNEQLEIIERRINSIVDEFYKREILKMADFIEKMDKMKTIKKYGNVTNADDVNCDIIEGNVINCDNVHCKEIRGNTINCEIYRE